nr:microcin C ABC transporter ATP-binding protein YejF [Klebsiella pneumoniae]
MMIAMALLTRPELLIADEPTTARTYRCRRKFCNCYAS